MALSRATGDLSADRIRMPRTAFFPEDFGAPVGEDIGQPKVLEFSRAFLEGGERRNTR